MQYNLAEKNMHNYILKKCAPGLHMIASSIGKPRVSPLLSLNTSAVIRYLICVYASHFFAGRPYHFNQTLRTVNKI